MKKFIQDQNEKGSPLLIIVDKDGAEHETEVSIIHVLREKIKDLSIPHNLIILNKKPMFTFIKNPDVEDAPENEDFSPTSKYVQAVLVMAMVSLIKGSPVLYLHDVNEALGRAGPVFGNPNWKEGYSFDGLKTCRKRAYKDFPQLNEFLTIKTKARKGLITVDFVKDTMIFFLGNPFREVWEVLEDMAFYRPGHIKNSSLDEWVKRVQSANGPEELDRMLGI